jgi:hypothetical protein
MMHRQDPDGQRSPRSAVQQSRDATVPQRSPGPRAVLASEFVQAAPGDPFLALIPRENAQPGPTHSQRTTRARVRGDLIHEANRPSSPQPASPGVCRPRSVATTLVPEGTLQL